MIPSLPNHWQTLYPFGHPIKLRLKNWHFRSCSWGGLYIYIYLYIYMCVCVCVWVCVCVCACVHWMKFSFIIFGACFKLLQRYLAGAEAIQSVGEKKIGWNQGAVLPGNTCLAKLSSLLGPWSTLKGKCRRAHEFLLMHAHEVSHSKKNAYQIGLLGKSDKYPYRTAEAYSNRYRYHHYDAWI